MTKYKTDMDKLYWFDKFIKKYHVFILSDNPVITKSEKLKTEDTRQIKENAK